MIETHEKIIDDATYTVTQLPARRAIKLKAKLLKLFGPVIAQFFVISDSKDDSQEYKSTFVRAVEKFALDIDPNTIDTLIVEILQGVRKNGMELTQATIDVEFSGDIAGIYKLIMFVLEVNYLNFFQMVGIGHLFEPLTPIPKEAITKRTYMRQ